MDFISQRQSYASSFAQRTQRQSSYLLSSRASRRKLIYDQSSDHHHHLGNNEDGQMDDFKQQIQQRYILSVANKIYTFPFTQDLYDDLSDDQDISAMQNIYQCNLIQMKGKDSNNNEVILPMSNTQNSNSINLQSNRNKINMKKGNNNGNNFKILNKKSQNKTVNDLLQFLRNQKERLQNLKSYVKQNFECSNSTAGNSNSNGVSKRTSNTHTSNNFIHDKNNSASISMGLKKDGNSGSSNINSSKQRYANNNMTGGGYNQNQNSHFLNNNNGINSNSTNLLLHAHLKTSYQPGYYEAIQQQSFRNDQKMFQRQRDKTGNAVSNQRKRLKTEPYEKPTGLIVKKSQLRGKINDR